MGPDFFTEVVLPQLEAASNAGDSTNEMGTRLIGHAPEIAPRAYVHVMYAPLTEDALRELRERLKRPIPREYEAFLAKANGLSLFTGSLRVLGYVPMNNRADTSVYSYPTNVLIPNVTARLRGLTHEAVVVGWCMANNYYVAIEKDGTVIRHGSSPKESWPSFASWLTTEIRAKSTARSTPVEPLH